MYFLMLFFNYKTCHTHLKCRRPIQKSNQTRLALTCICFSMFKDKHIGIKNWIDEVTYGCCYKILSEMWAYSHQILQFHPAFVILGDLIIDIMYTKTEEYIYMYVCMYMYRIYFLFLSVEIWRLVAQNNTAHKYYLWNKNRIGVPTV